MDWVGFLLWVGQNRSKLLHNNQWNTKMICCWSSMSVNLISKLYYIMK